jgi:hypothetical protein
VDEEFQWVIFFSWFFVARANQKIRILALGRWSRGSFECGEHVTTASCLITRLKPLRVNSKKNDRSWPQSGRMQYEETNKNDRNEVITVRRRIFAGIYTKTARGHTQDEEQKKTRTAAKLAQPSLRRYDLS